MAHTNETTFLGLPVYGADDKGTWLGDVNGTNAKIDTFAATISGSVDSLDTIANAAKDSADASAEAVSGMSGDVTALQGSVNTINSLIGNGTPTTTDKTIIGAINELKSDIDNIGTPTAAEVSFDDTGLSITADNVQDAIEALISGGTTGETIRFDATTGYIQLKDGQGWFNWAKASRAIWDAIADATVLQTMGYSTYNAPTVTSGANNVTIASDSTNGLGWVYVAAQTSPYTLHIEGTLTVTTPYGSGTREALHIATYDSLSGGTSSGATNLGTYADSGTVSATYNIPANKIVGLNIDGVNNGGVTLTLTEFYGA